MHSLHREVSGGAKHYVITRVAAAQVKIILDFKLDGFKPDHQTAKFFQLYGIPTAH